MSNKIKFRNIEEEAESHFSVYELKIEELKAENEMLKTVIKSYWVEGNKDLKQKYEETD